MDYERILIIILAVTLFILLILAIVVTIFMLKIVRSVKDISAKADMAAHNFVSFSETMKKAATPAMITGIVGSFARKFFRSKVNKRKGK